ncbi:MAG: hypothetical protein IPK46_02375 [Saprospiraceae bacterium]|nr:hypothetical protein [Saprospiraceae bacterium]
MKTILSIAFTILLAFSAGSQNKVNSMKDLDYGVEVKTLKVKGISPLPIPMKAPETKPLCLFTDLLRTYRPGKKIRLF